MKVLMIASLLSSELFSDYGLGGRNPASSPDNQTIGSCMLGLHGAIHLRAPKKDVDPDIVRKECLRLISLSGPSQTQGTERHMHFCGLGYGAFTSVAVGKMKFAEMYASEELQKEMKKICL